MKYLVHAVIDFAVDADSRAEAHVEAANRLIEADLAGFDLASLGISGPIKPSDHAARDLSLNVEPSLFPASAPSSVVMGEVPPPVYQNSGGTVDTSGVPDAAVTWDNT